MIAKWSELSLKERTIIHRLILVVIIAFALILSVKAYKIYEEQGFQTCLIETETNGTETKLCFNTSSEAKEYLQAKSYPKNLDYKYLNEYINISYVE